MLLALTKYGAVLRGTLLTNVTYWGDLVIRSLFMLVVLFTFVQLWVFTFQDGSVEQVAGFSLRDIIWYLVVTETVVLSAPRVSARMDQEVKSGELAYVLTKPYNYVAYHLAAYWGQALLQLPLNAGLGAAVALAAVGPPDTSAPAVLATLAVVVLSLTLNFLFEVSIGLLAFWFEDTQAFVWVYQKLVFTVGGMMLPLEMLPDLLGGVAVLLPFAAVTYVPGRIFVGAPLEMTAGLVGLQLFWLAALALLVAAIYRRAVEKVTVHGG